MNFRAGQTVARDKEGGEWLDLTVCACPDVGEPCVIAATGEMKNGHQALFFADYPTPEGTAWDASYFRLVVKRKTDISIFTKMLTPNKETAQ